MKTATLTFLFFTLTLNVAFANVTILNGLTHIYSGKSGEVIYGEVVLINNSIDDQRVTFNLTEAIFSCSKNRFFSKDAKHPNSSTNWINDYLSDKVLAPKEKYVYQFKIIIPKNAALQGSYWSVIMVNVEKPIKENLLNKQIGLDTKVRYAIGLVTNVNDYDDVEIDFKNIELNEKNDLKYLKVTIANESLFVEGVKLSLEVYNQEGIKVHEFKSDRNMAFPGFCREYLLDISVLASGSYECVLIADSREEFIGTNISLTIK